MCLFFSLKLCFELFMILFEYKFSMYVFVSTVNVTTVDLKKITFY